MLYRPHVRSILGTAVVALLLSTAAAVITPDGLFDISPCLCCDCTMAECTFNFTRFKAGDLVKEPWVESTCAWEKVRIWQFNMKANPSNTSMESITVGILCAPYYTTPMCSTTTSSTSNAASTTMDSSTTALPSTTATIQSTAIVTQSTTRSTTTILPTTTVVDTTLKQSTTTSPTTTIAPTTIKSTTASTSTITVAPITTRSTINTAPTTSTDPTTTTSKPASTSTFTVAPTTTRSATTSTPTFSTTLPKTASTAAPTSTTTVALTTTRSTTTTTPTTTSTAASTSTTTVAPTTIRSTTITVPTSSTTSFTTASASTTVAPTPTRSTTTTAPTTASSTTGSTFTTTVAHTTTKSTTAATSTTTAAPTTTTSTTPSTSTTTKTPTTTIFTTTTSPSTTALTTSATSTATLAYTTIISTTTTAPTTTVSPTTNTSTSVSASTTTVTPTTTISKTTAVSSTAVLTGPTTVYWGGSFTGSTTNSSDAPISNTTTCPDVNDNDICDDYESLRCEYSVLSGSAYTVAKIFMYIATIWVILWCIATIVANVLHKNTGHHRWIHLLEELGIIVLWMFIGILNLTMRNNSFCKVNSIVIHYFIVMIAACFVFEAIFANSMVHNKKKLNGSIPPLLNYVVPILVALIPSLITYFTNKQYYGANGMHCFVFTQLSIMYAFVLPVGALLMIASFVSSLGNLACDLTRRDQDSSQCYWAKKSCKILSFLSFWIFSAYLTCMFGSSSQRLWVLILFVLQSLVLGPIIFVAHTFCHVNTASKCHRPSFPGRFYAPCHLTRTPLIAPPLAMHKYCKSPVVSPMPPRPAKEVFEKPHRGSAIKTGDEHMVASDLWGWASTKGEDERRDEVLFAPKPV